MTDDFTSHGKPYKSMKMCPSCIFIVVRSHQRQDYDPKDAFHCVQSDPCGSLDLGQSTILSLVPVIAWWLCVTVNPARRDNVVLFGTIVVNSIPKRHSVRACGYCDA